MQETGRSEVQMPRLEQLGYRWLQWTASDCVAIYQSAGPPPSPVLAMLNDSTLRSTLSPRWSAQYLRLAQMLGDGLGAGTNLELLVDMTDVRVDRRVG